MSKESRLYTYFDGEARKHEPKKEISPHMTGESQVTSIDEPKNLENVPALVPTQLCH